MRYGIIYKYTSPSGKCYIGQTITETARKWRHINESKTRVTKFYTAIRKYGINNFTYEVLFKEQFTDKLLIKEILCTQEEQYIILFNSVINGYNLLFSSKEHPLTNHKPTTTHCKSISDRMLGNKYAIGNRGKRDINGKSIRTGRNTIMIQQYTRDNVLIKQFNSTKNAAQELCILGSSITKALKGVVKSAGGFKWKYTPSYPVIES